MPRVDYERRVRQLEMQIQRVRQLEMQILGTSAALPTIVSTTPYAISDGEVIVCDMSSGDIVVVLPASMAEGCVIIRDGVPNVLTVQGTLNGVVDGTIDYDNTALQIIWDGTEYRIK